MVIGWEYKIQTDVTHCAYDGIAKQINKFIMKQNQQSLRML